MQRVTVQGPPVDSEKIFRSQGFFFFFSFVFFHIQWTSLKTMADVCVEGCYRVSKVAASNRKSLLLALHPQGQGRQAFLVRGVLLCRQSFPLVQDAGVEVKGTAWLVSPEGPSVCSSLSTRPSQHREGPRELCPSPQNIQSSPQRRQTFWRSDGCQGLSGRALPISAVPGNTGLDVAVISIFSSILMSPCGVHLATDPMSKQGIFWEYHPTLLPKIKQKEKVP